MQNFYKLVVTAFTLISIFVSGCSSTDPTRVEADYGNSVRNMIEAQIYDPDAAKYPPSEPPTTLDGSYAEMCWKRIGMTCQDQKKLTARS